MSFFLFLIPQLLAPWAKKKATKKAQRDRPTSPSALFVDHLYCGPDQYF